LLDARKNLPPQYAAHNMKNSSHGKLCLRKWYFVVAEYFMRWPEL
jgi:hypothetical protein